MAVRIIITDNIPHGQYLEITKYLSGKQNIAIEDFEVRRGNPPRYTNIIISEKTIAPQTANSVGAQEARQNLKGLMDLLYK